MQARTIILADHSGTAQAETHSQWFYISGHCGGISSVTCCLWLVNTQCVFSPGVPNNRGKKKKIQNIAWTWELCLKEHTFFHGLTWGMLVELRVASVWFSKQITQDATEKKKKAVRPPVHIKNGGAQTNGVVSMHHLKGGIIQARQMKFRRQWKTNTASRLQCDF